MGYFKRPVRRGPSRAAIREALHATRRMGAGPARAWHARREVYLRFCAGRLNEESHHDNGIFHASVDLQHPGRLTDSQRAVVDESVEWFNENLVAPELDEPRAIFWFRAESASACVARLWDRVKVIRESGIIVRVLRCRDPGLIVYRDEHQVAAVPQRRVRWRYRAL